MKKHEVILNDIKGFVKEHSLPVKAACGVTAAALVITGIGAATYESLQTPGIVEAEEKATEADADKADAKQAKELEETVTSAVNTGGTADKEETVYLFADADGSVNDVVVSDWLKNPEKEDLLSDRTTLTDIENVKGEEKFTQDGKALTWDAGGNDIYYQGKTDKEVPVGVKVSYELDGKKVTAKEIAGKSGRVKIRFDYTNTAKTKVDGKNVTVPFTMITGVILPVGTFSDVEVSNGQLISEGENAIALGFAFPGLDKAIDGNSIRKDVKKLSKKDKDLSIPDHVEITADAEDFELGMTMTVGLPNVLSQVVDMDDTGLNDLSGAMEDLDEGVGTLSDGTNALAEGAGELDANSGKLTDGALALKNGVAGQLASGAGQLADALDQMNKAMENSSKDLDNLQAASADVNAFADGSKQVADGTVTYIDSVQSGVATAQAGIKQDLTADQQAAVSAICAQFGCDAGTALGYAKNPSSAVQAIVAKHQDQMAAAAESGDAQAMSQVSAAIAGEATTFGSNAGKLAELQSVQTSLDKNLGALSTPEAQKQTAQLKAGAQKISKAAPQIKNYTAGTNSLIASTKQLKGGIAQLAAGASKLSNGISLGPDSLVSGTGSLYEGIVAYTNGVSQLAEGTDELNNGVQELIDSIGNTDDVDTLVNRLQSVLDSGNNYKNFSGISKKSSGKVKFIIKTDGVKAE